MKYQRFTLLGCEDREIRKFEFEARTQFFSVGSSSCGANTVSCYNTPGAYYCSCKTGFENWTEGEGCTDRDECSGQ